METEQKDYNKSFNSKFCVHLEYAISREFQYSADKELKHFWCDGVSSEPLIGFENNKEYLDYKNISKTKFIETIAWTGQTGQTIYNLTINLGKQSLKEYKDGLSLIDCIPEENTRDWIDIDVENKTMEIKLN
ncbi:hypothetical protein [Psychroserpens ponticola]|uniref:Uncharacterized protein n=1 Tax=Psychroserpens ponticola TaxID=2932268 RepID=A0ABY7S2G7_9FLAO|nr:hypothetical protein [Psychroserpens ponticola]WCO03537.1 hypothetical protein MUN68_008515 [Psychroserpens ponticola]